jgi:hypothetical protein
MEPAIMGKLLTSSWRKRLMDAALLAVLLAVSSWLVRG